ncbi:MAG: hypothetical protein IBJ11_06055 [Phycisphaerales bacterium]|nr:hypothetical protein [Phycisphaerales bacterium]
MSAHTHHSAGPAAGALCPYCGHVSADPLRCDECQGLFEPLSRQATQNTMGPWQLRSAKSPFHPGFSFETLRTLVLRGRITPETIIRGPTTRQFWAYARSTPGVAVLLGMCHGCHAAVRPTDTACHACGANLNPPTDRQTLGLSPVQLLPGQASAAAVAASSVRMGSQRPDRPPPAPAAPAGPARPPAAAAAPPRPAPPRVARAGAEADDTARAVINALQDRLSTLRVLVVVLAVVTGILLLVFALLMLNRSLLAGLVGTPAPATAPPAAPVVVPAAPAGAVGSEAPAPPGAAASAQPGLAPAGPRVVPPPPAQPEAADAPPSALDPSAPPDERTLALDGAFKPFFGEYRRIKRLIAQDTAQSLAEAVSALRRLRRDYDNLGQITAATAQTVTVLEQVAEQAERRLQDLRLRDQL